MKDFWKYLTFGDMGQIGEGCLASFAIWGFIAFVTIITIIVTILK